jgi:hypothetical protein
MARTKIYEDDAARVRAWRERQREQAAAVSGVKVDTSGPEHFLRQSADMLAHLTAAQTIGAGMARALSEMLETVQQANAERDGYLSDLADALRANEAAEAEVLRLRALVERFEVQRAKVKPASLSPRTGSGESASGEVVARAARARKAAKA